MTPGLFSIAAGFFALTAVALGAYLMSQEEEEEEAAASDEQQMVETDTAKQDKCQIDEKSDCETVDEESSRSCDCTEDDLADTVSDSDDSLLESKPLTPDPTDDVVCQRVLVAAGRNSIQLEVDQPKLLDPSDAFSLVAVDENDYAVEASGQGSECRYLIVGEKPSNVRDGDFSKLYRVEEDVKISRYQDPNGQQELGGDSPTSHFHFSKVTLIGVYGKSTEEDDFEELLKKGGSYREWTKFFYSASEHDQQPYDFECHRGEDDHPAEESLIASGTGNGHIDGKTSLDCDQESARHDKQEVSRCWHCEEEENLNLQNEVEGTDAIAEQDILVLPLLEEDSLPNSANNHWYSSMGNTFDYDDPDGSVLSLDSIIIGGQQEPEVEARSPLRKSVSFLLEQDSLEERPNVGHSDTAGYSPMTLRKTPMTPRGTKTPFKNSNTDRILRKTKYVSPYSRAKISLR